MEDIQKVENTIVNRQNIVTLKKKLVLPIIAVVVGALLVVFAFLFTQGFVVAATVNGSPISRFSVIQELEKEGGKSTLETLINKKIIDAELAKMGIQVDSSELEERITELETQIATQGGTLEEALESEGMTLVGLRKQISTTLQLEKALAEKTMVSMEEVKTYIEANETQLPVGANADAVNDQVRNQLQQQKFQTEAQKWVAEITKEAKIKYYVTY